MAPCLHTLAIHKKGWNQWNARLTVRKVFLPLNNQPVGVHGFVKF